MRRTIFSVLILVAALSATAAAVQADAGNSIPREAPTGLEREALEHPGYTWHTFDGAACRAHYQPDTFAARHIAALTRSADASLARAVDLVGEGPYTRPLDVFFIDSREQMMDLISVRATGYADWHSSSVFLVVRPDWRSFDLHEITHVVSINRWGEPAEPVWWIREGLAVYSDGRCREHSVDEIAAEFMRRGELPKVRDLIDRFADVGEMPGYMCSGSLVGYLIDHYGIRKVKKIWQRGGHVIEQVLGVRLDTIDRDWRKSLEGIRTRPEADEWKRVIDIGCG